MRLFTLLLTITLILFLVGCARKADQQEQPTKMKVGLVFDVGGRGDKSFNDAAYRGLEKAKKELGMDFEYIEPGPGADREAALRQLANHKDIALIFGIGFIFTDDITTIAREFPSKKFACVDYTYDSTRPLPPNLVALLFREEEGSFLVGTLAALLTKTNVIGFIGGMQSPLIKKFEAGYIAGARYANPKCEVLVGYAGTTGEAFKNPGKGKELALGQYTRGADIIYHASGVTGLGVFEAARELKKLAIGVDSDQYHEAPGNILTSMTKIVDTAVFQSIKAAKESTFVGGRAMIFDLKSNGVDYVYDQNNKSLIPDDVHTKVEETRRKIVSGEITVPYQ
ncbi:MAG: BMP family ABC transporter substrate-binding protein [Ignavibacteriae bacterium]|nr:BMP family ABC transporter substrate-binding protein [Ignavibacteria bacterium]MBI3363673.1 BMP family ABC transporter substrate-binding protein [Ignavibacteriota bacterium]